jgi:cytochrome c1
MNNGHSSVSISNLRLLRSQKSTASTATENQEKAKPQDDDIDPLQAQYVTPVYSFYCTLCDVLLKERNARAEHFKLDTHIEKFNKAEEERKIKEAAQKAEEDAEKAKNGESDEKTEEKEEPKNAEEAQEAEEEQYDEEEAGEEEVEQAEHEAEQEAVEGWFHSKKINAFNQF